MGGGAGGASSAGRGEGGRPEAEGAAEAHAHKTGATVGLPAHMARLLPRTDAVPLAEVEAELRAAGGKEDRLVAVLAKLCLHGSPPAGCALPLADAVSRLGGNPKALRRAHYLLARCLEAGGGGLSSAASHEAGAVVLSPPTATSQPWP